MRAARLGLSALLLAALSMLGFGAPAHATASYDLSLASTVPSVGAYDSFTYKVGLNFNGTTEAVKGLEIKVKLDSALVFDKVVVSSASPVTGTPTVDKATNTVTFKLKDIVDKSSEFSFSVTQLNGTQNKNLNQDTVFTSTASGNAPNGIDAPSPAPADTRVTGTMSYKLAKNATTILGSDRRYVTYHFNISHSDASHNFLLENATITDVVDKGTVTAWSQNSYFGGSWTKSTNADGKTVMTWTASDKIGPAANTDRQKVWFTVYYSPTDVKTGLRPPTNTATLSATQPGGVGAVTFPQATAQSMPVQDPTQEAVHAETTITNGGKVQNNGTGAGYGLNATGSYINPPVGGVSNGHSLDELTVQSTRGEDNNGDFFDHVKIQNVSIVPDAALQGLDLPMEFWYTTNQRDWTKLEATATTGGTTNGVADKMLNPTVQYAAPGTFVGNGPAVPLAPGEWITGYRVTVKAADGKTIPENSEIALAMSISPSYASLSTGEMPANGGPAGPYIGTVTTKGVSSNGVAIADAKATASLTVTDLIPIGTSVSAPTALSVGNGANYVVNISNVDAAGREFKQSYLDVVLPVGVVFDRSKGVAPTAATESITGLPIPKVGDGVEVTTPFTVTDADGEHQVVRIKVDSLESLRRVGLVKTPWNSTQLQYNLPVNVLAAASKYAGKKAPVSTWAYTEDPAYTTIAQGCVNGGCSTAADKYGVQKTRAAISTASATSQVNAAGNLLIDKQVKAANGTWDTEGVTDTKATNVWKVTVSNYLSGAVTQASIFDRLPSTSDGRGSDIDLTLAGPVTGAPDGATIEYSSNAVSATDTKATWGTQAEGATSFRVTGLSLAAGSSFELSYPTVAPDAELLFKDEAINVAQVGGSYGGSARSWNSNQAKVVAVAHPALALTKKTNGTTYTQAPGALLRIGVPVNWIYVVTNTGNAPVDDVAVEDEFEDGAGKVGTQPATSSETGPLAPGASRTFTASGTSVEGQYTNTAVASAIVPEAEGDDATVSSKKASSYYKALPPPATIVTKRVTGEGADKLDPATRYHFSYTLTGGSVEGASGTFSLRDGESFLIPGTFEGQRLTVKENAPSGVTLPNTGKVEFDEPRFSVSTTQDENPTAVNDEFSVLLEDSTKIYSVLAENPTAYTPPPTADVTVTKHVTGADAALAPSDRDYVVNYRVKAPGESAFGPVQELKVKDGATATFAAVKGSEISFAEDQPEDVTLADRRTLLYGAPEFSVAGSAEAAGSTLTLTTDLGEGKNEVVLNNPVTTRPAPVTSVVIEKKVVGDEVGDALKGKAYTVNVSVKAPGAAEFGAAQAIQVAAGGRITLENVVIGSQIKLSEAALEDIKQADGTTIRFEDPSFAAGSSEGKEVTFTVGENEQENHVLLTNTVTLVPAPTGGVSLEKLVTGEGLGDLLDGKEYEVSYALKALGSEDFAEPETVTLTAGQRLDLGEFVVGSQLRFEEVKPEAVTLDDGRTLAFEDPAFAAGDVRGGNGFEFTVGGNTDLNAVVLTNAAHLIDVPVNSVEVTKTVTGAGAALLGKENTYTVRYRATDRTGKVTEGTLVMRDGKTASTGPIAVGSTVEFGEEQPGDVTLKDGRTVAFGTPEFSRGDEHGTTATVGLEAGDPVQLALENPTTLQAAPVKPTPGKPTAPSSTPATDDGIDVGGVGQTRNPSAGGEPPQGSSAADGSELPTTGASPAVLVAGLAGLLLVAMAGALLVVSRRKARRH